MQVTALSLPVVLPEAVLAAGTLALVLYGALRGERASNLVTEIAVGLLGVVFIVLVAKNRPMGVTFYGSFADDAFTRFMSAVALIGSLATMVLSAEFMRKERIGGFEFPILILICTLGILMLISADDFIALYLGLELMSLSLYVIAAYRRHDLRATEAGLKYFVLGALSSGMLLYGASLIYGYSGSVSFAAVASAVHDHAGYRRSVRPRVRAGGPGVQDLRRAVPYVDAGRLRGRADAGDHFLRHRAQDRGDGGPGSKSWSPPFPASPATGARSSPSFRSPRWASALLPLSARPISNA